MNGSTALSGFQVIVAVVAEFQRPVDIADIQGIDESEHLLSVSRLSSNRVMVVVYKRTVCQKSRLLLFASRGDNDRFQKGMQTYADRANNLQ